MLLTPEQLYAIQKIITEHHSAFMVNTIGPEVVPEEVLKILKEKGLIKDLPMRSIGEAYTYGQLLGTLETENIARMSYDQFKNHVRVNPVPLTEAERGAMAMAAQSAGQYCRGLGNKVDLATGSILIEADRKLRARMEADIRTETEANIAKRESIEQLKSDLGWATKDWARDLKRIAVTEKVTAMNQGMSDHFKKRYGADSLVAKRAMPDACPHCQRLHNGPSGPRVFKLSTLEAHGTNVGRKANDWQAVVGSTHPNCQCVLIRVPEGWGWDEFGDLVPGGKVDMYDSSEELELAMLQEDDLQKAFQLQGQMSYQGIPIAIENRAGSIRDWNDLNGDKEQTLMSNHYGYVQGTIGLDGDEIDVFVGPDPRAKRVYIVEQQNPHTGQYDEQKCFIGFPNQDFAERAYRLHYDNPDDFLLTIQAMDLDAFKRWVAITSPKGSEFLSDEVSDIRVEDLDPNDEPKLIILISEQLAKAPPVGGKYIKRVPYTDKEGHKRYRYYYSESAIARDVKAGETLKLGKQFATVESISSDGTIQLKVGSASIQVDPKHWDNLLATHYGEAYYKWAEKRATASVDAVLRHVPKQDLVDLKGATDAERLADLKVRVPQVYDKLQKSFSRAGINPFRAKTILATSLERKGWEPEARAAVIGDVITKRNSDYRTAIKAAENLAGGSTVKLGHIAAVTEIVKVVNNPEKDEIAEVATRAEAELAKLSELLAKAHEGNSQDAANALATALSSVAMHKLNLIAKAFPGVVDKAVEPVRTTLLEVASVAPTPTPKSDGSSTTVYVAGEGGQPKGINARYKLIEADSAIASHDPKTFNRRADYPEGVQERAYHRDKAEQAKVMRNAQKLIPSFVVNTNPDAVNGAPIIGPDGVVLGGNSRTMSMQLAYANHPDKATELRNYLLDHAHEAGFSKEDVSQFKNPILVRVVENSGNTKEEKQLLVRQMNESFTQDMDPRTLQVAQGRKLTEETLKELGNAMSPDETLSEFLVTKKAEPFINALQKAGIIDQRNANRYFEKGTKRLNSDGKTLVSRILVGRAIDDADVLSSTKTSIVDNLAQAVPYIEQAKTYGEGFNLTEDLKTALDAYNSLQYRVDTKSMPPLNKDMTAQRFDSLFAQQEMFGTAHPITTNPKAMHLLEVLIRQPGPKQTATVFKDYAEQAKANPENQVSMFGPAKTAKDVLKEVVDKHVKELRKSFIPVIPLDTDLIKSGPIFIGPRGGKWADAKHTISWQPDEPATTKPVVSEKSSEQKQLNLFASMSTKAIVATDPALSPEQKAKPISEALQTTTQNIEAKVKDPEQWKLPPGARLNDPFKPPEIDPNATWEHPDYGEGVGAAPWQKDMDWKPDFTKYAYILVNSSGGKDSQAQLTAIVEHADKVGYPRKNIVVVHADLGRVEWEGSKSTAQQQAEFYGVRFEVVKRTQNDLIDQIDERHGDLVQREIDVATLGEAGIKTWGELANTSESRILTLIGDGNGVSKWGGEHRAKQLIRAGKAKLERDVGKHQKKVEAAEKNLNKLRDNITQATSDPQRLKARTKFDKAKIELEELKEKGKPENWPIDFGKSIPWPSMDARFCTSDHKRAEIKKFITRLTQEYTDAHGKGTKPRILNTMGIRAQESPGRAKMDSFTREEESGARIVDRWYPIHLWPESKVWETIKASKVPHHRAYDIGMRRLSCCFCVFASKEDLTVAAIHNPELFKTYLALEEKVGVDFQPQLSLHSIAAEIEKRRSEGYELNELAQWVKKALGLSVELDLIKAAISEPEIKPALIGVLLESALIRLQKKNQDITTVVLDWKANGLCIHLDTAINSIHVVYLPYPEAYNTSLMVAAFARRHGFDIEENNEPGPTPDEESLEKSGGPYIGPRGGKWADPEHTIPWEEPEALSAKAVENNNIPWNIEAVKQPFYHGSKVKIKEIDPNKLQTRDTGFYGNGFYVTASKDLAKTYGKTISVFRFKPDTKILGPFGLSPKDINKDLYKKVIEHLMTTEYPKAKARGKGEAFIEETIKPLNLNSPDFSPIAWKDSAYRYSKAMGADVHYMSPGEVVVMNPDTAESVKKSLAPEIATLSSRAANRAPGPGLGVNYVIPMPDKVNQGEKDKGYFPARDELFREKETKQEEGALHVDKDVYDFIEILLNPRPYEYPQEVAEAHEEAREGTKERSEYVKNERLINAPRPKNKVVRTPIKK